MIVPAAVMDANMGVVAASGDVGPLRDPEVEDLHPAVGEETIGT